MANVPAKKKPTSGQLITSDFTQELEDLRTRFSAPTGNRIKVQASKTFKLPDGAESNLITGIIVDFVYYNAYYESAFDPNDRTPPSCFALAPTEDELIPSENSPEVQSTGGCKGCAQNQYGTAGKGKACRNSVLIALLPTDATDETPLWLINVSPTGISQFSSYGSSVANGLKRPLYAVSTDIGFNAQKTFASLIFGNPVPLEEGAWQMAKSRKEEARRLLLTEPDVTAIVAANDKKLQAPKKRAAGR